MPFLTMLVTLPEASQIQLSALLYFKHASFLFLTKVMSRCTEQIRSSRKPNIGMAQSNQSVFKINHPEQTVDHKSKQKTAPSLKIIPSQQNKALAS